MESRVIHPRFAPQEALFTRLCGEAKAAIAAAPTREEAVKIKDELCRKFEEECVSGILVTGTRAFADGLIETLWAGK
jgi:hypothetical protein